MSWQQVDELAYFHAATNMLAAHIHAGKQKKIYANNRDRMHDINGIQIQFETERKSGSVRFGCVIFTLEIASKFS